MQEDPKPISRGAELFNLLRKAASTKVDDSGQSNTPNNLKQTAQKVSPAAKWLLIALVGTTIASQTVAVFFCHLALICLIYLIINKSAYITKSMTAIALLLATASIISGCGPLLTEPNTEIATLCEERVGTSCSMGVSQGWTVLGWPVNYATTDQAKLDGGVSDVFGLERITGHGLVSVTRIAVYGS